jgi:hypothetical protein
MPPISGRAIRAANRAEVLSLQERERRAQLLAQQFAKTPGVNVSSHSSISGGNPLFEELSQQLIQGSGQQPSAARQTAQQFIEPEEDVDPMSNGGIKQLLSIRSAAIKRGDAEARDRANDILAKISGTEFRGAEDPGRIRITTGDTDIEPGLTQQAEPFDPTADIDELQFMTAVRQNQEAVRDKNLTQIGRLQGRAITASNPELVSRVG